MNAPVKLPLADRIAASFDSDLSSSELKALLEEVTQAEIEARAVAASATERALDPATKPAEVTKARQAKEDAEFSLARMATATPRLQERLLGKLESERQAIAAAQMKAALAERDDLVKELAETYPAMVAKLTDLLARVRDNNAKLPIGQGAEDIARRAPANWRVSPSGSMPSLVDSIRLPSFELNMHGSGYAWIRGQNC